MVLGFQIFLHFHLLSVLVVSPSLVVSIRITVHISVSMVDILCRIVKMVKASVDRGSEVNFEISCRARSIIR